MVSSMMSSRFGEGFRQPSDREDIVYRDRGQLGLEYALSGEEPTLQLASPMLEQPSAGEPMIGLTPERWTS